MDAQQLDLVTGRQQSQDLRAQVSPLHEVYVSVEWRPTDRELAEELEDLRARLAAARREEMQRRDELEQLRRDFARLSAQLRQLRQAPSD